MFHFLCTLLFLLWEVATHKVDEADVDTSNSMESSNKWIQALEALAC